MSYFSNLYLAFCGKNPYRIEISDLRKKHEDCIGKMESANDKCVSLERDLAKERQKTADFRQLTENLRQTITDKDIVIYGLRHDIKETLQKLQQANRLVAKEVMAQTMLDKTNVAIKDLITAIDSENIQTVRACLTWLDWSDPLRILAEKYYALFLKTEEKELTPEEEG